MRQVTASERTPFARRLAGVGPPVPRFHPVDGRGMFPIGALAGSCSEMKALAHRGEALAATLLLLAPAMWNGFPFLQYDSGGYLARWFEGYLVPSRSTVYGLFAVTGNGCRKESIMRCHR